MVGKLKLNLSPAIGLLIDIKLADPLNHATEGSLKSEVQHTFNFLLTRLSGNPPRLGGGFPLNLVKFASHF